MKTINDELKELTAILNGDSTNKEEEYQQKFLYIQEHYTTKADSEAIADWLLNGYHELAKEAEELNRTIALQEKIKEMKEIVPISYIARISGKVRLGCNSVFMATRYVAVSIR